MLAVDLWNNEPITPVMWLVMIIAACIFDWLLGNLGKFLHPVFFTARWIFLLRNDFKKGKALRIKGALIWLMLVFFSGLILCVIQWLLLTLLYPLGILILSFLLSSFLSMKSLREGILLGGEENRQEGVRKARLYAGHIRKRQKEAGTRSGMLRAVIEVSAEQAVEGVLSPLLYMVFGIITSMAAPCFNPLTLSALYAVTRMMAIPDEKRDQTESFLRFPVLIDRILCYFPVRISAFLLMISGGILGYDANSGVRQLFRKKQADSQVPRLQQAVAGLFHLKTFGNSKVVDLQNPFISPSYGHVESVFAMTELSEVLILCLCAFIVAVIYLPGYLIFIF